MQVKRNGEWLSAMIGEECAIMSVENGSYVAISRVGARIWELIEPPIAVSDLCAKLQDEFDVTAEVCRAEVDAFLGEMQACHAIVLSPA
jgi:hypothetical protein